MSLFQLPSEVLCLVLQRASSSQDALALVSVCKQLYDVWTTHGATILWSLWKTEIPAMEEALISLRAAGFVRDYEARKEPLPFIIDIAQFDYSHKRPELSEFNGIWAQNHIAELMHDHFLAECMYFPRDSGGSDDPERVEECRERIHKSLYRILIAGASLAGVYNAPMYAESPIDSSEELSDEQLEAVAAKFPAYKSRSDPKDDETMFGTFATWLRDSTLADTELRRGMAQRHEDKEGRGQCCVRNEADYVDFGHHSSSNAAEEPEPQGCHLRDTDGLSHSDTHLILWQVMQMMALQGYGQCMLKRSPNVAPPPGDPDAFHIQPIVLFGEFRAREVHFSRPRPAPAPVHIILRPAAHRIPDRRRIHQDQARGQGDWEAVLDRIGAAAQQTDTQEETRYPPMPLRCKLFEYLLRRVAGLRFPHDYFQEDWGMHWRDQWTLQTSFQVFASDEVEGRYPIGGDYVTGDYMEGSEVLERVW